MKDSGREFQVEGNKNKGPRTETSLQSQECLKKKKTERKPVGVKHDKEMGKSWEPGTRLITPSRDFILVE